MSEAVVITIVGFGGQLFPNIAPKESPIGREIFMPHYHTFCAGTGIWRRSEEPRARRRLTSELFLKCMNNALEIVSFVS